MRAKPHWLEGYKPSAAVADTGSVSYGRKEGAYGQTHHVPHSERRKRDRRSSGNGRMHRTTGVAAPDAAIARQSGRSSLRCGKHTTRRRTAVIAEATDGRRE